MDTLRRNDQGPQVRQLPAQRGYAVGINAAFDAKAWRAVPYTIEGNRSPRVQGFSYVPSRMDQLLGHGHLS